MNQGVMETTNCWISMGDDGILRLVTKPQTKSTLETVREEHQAIKKIIGNQRVPMLTDIRNMISATPEARAYTNSPEITYTYLAVGLLVGSVFSRVIGSFIIGINKPDYPVKLFTDEKSAIEWLKQFLL
ncbi:MAG: hypothetical protein SF052_07235 [Bacteroidia bacterium]|nr:hypothetical protein [Bacteroidia bacterium]